MPPKQPIWTIKHTNRSLKNDPLFTESVNAIKNFLNRIASYENPLQGDDDIIEFKSIKHAVRYKPPIHIRALSDADDWRIVFIVIPKHKIILVVGIGYKDSIERQDGVVIPPIYNRIQNLSMKKLLN